MNAKQKRRISKQVQASNQGYLNNMSGRRRKLSDGAMLDICRLYASGESVRDLSSAYGVSTHTIYSIVYWTPRDRK